MFRFSGTEKARQKHFPPTIRPDFPLGFSIDAVSYDAFSEILISEL